MDTFVKKLRGVSSNQNLPIYENVVLKNWIKKTVEGQYIDLSSRVPGIKMNDYEVSVDFMIPSDSLYLDSGNITLAATRAVQATIRVNNNIVQVRSATASETFSQEVSLDALHTIVLNTNTTKITLDGVEYSSTIIPSTSNVTEYWLLEQSIIGCGVYLGEVKFKKATSDNYEFILVPAIVNGISCYKNTLVNNDYIYANTGELIAFNL